LTIFILLGCPPSRKFVAKLYQSSRQYRFGRVPASSIR
jgi:hypothetical protein